MTGHFRCDDKTLSLRWQDIVSMKTGHCQCDDMTLTVWQNIVSMVTGHCQYDDSTLSVWQDIVSVMTGHCQYGDRTLTVWWQDIVSMMRGHSQYDDRTMSVWWQDIVSMVTGHCQFTTVAFRSQTTNAPIQFPPVSSARRRTLTAGTDIQSASRYRNRASRWRWGRCGLTSGLNTQFLLVSSRSLGKEFVLQKQVK
jgi:hypothetical protein